MMGPVQPQQRDGPVIARMDLKVKDVEQILYPPKIIYKMYIVNMCFAVVVLHDAETKDMFSC